MQTQVEIEPLIDGPPPKGTPLLERAGLAMFWNAAFLPLKLLVNLGASVVLFRVLNVQNVALYFKLSSVLALLGVLSDLGIERALPRFVPEVEMREGRPGLLRFLRVTALIRIGTLLPFLMALLIFPDFFWNQLQLAPSDLPPGFTNPRDLEPL